MRICRTNLGELESEKCKCGHPGETFEGRVRDAVGATRGGVVEGVQLTGGSGESNG
jgi:hypothetical protein